MTHLLLSIVVHTANLLGIFTDPFEFAGDYGPVVNPIRDKVFEAVVAKESLAKPGDPEAIARDRDYGPTLGELVTSALLRQLEEKQKELQNVGFRQNDLHHIQHFVNRYGNQKIFYLFRHNPPELLGLDKALRDHASREGKSFDLPILSSTEPLKGKNGDELKSRLMEVIFIPENFQLAKPETTLNESLKKLNPNYLQTFFGEGADTRDLELFSSPAGQVFFYWAYQALNLHLISQNPALIEEINQVKSNFAETIGNLSVRAHAFKEKLLKADSKVLFTQESDTLVAKALTQEELFLPVKRQNSQDGTLVFLRGDEWEPDYELIPLENYPGYQEGRINLILATRKKTGEKFFLVSAHGHSTKAEDGRLQITLAMGKFHQLSLTYPQLQFVMGIDANTKTEEEVRLLREHLEHLGLVATNVGPTTIKQRMVTAQHAKAGKIAIDEEDYLIILKPEQGGCFIFTHPTVGFKEEKAGLTNPLPNQLNPSDHYPVGATLKHSFP